MSDRQYQLLFKLHEELLQRAETVWMCYSIYEGRERFTFSLVERPGWALLHSSLSFYQFRRWLGTMETECKYGTAVESLSPEERRGLQDRAYNGWKSRNPKR